MRHFVALLILALACPGWALTNQLAQHPSPYLAMHGQDPVAWQDWSEAVLRRARAENKPIFLSSGYFACHWCHVMQQESYQDPAIARQLNEAFIPVKIDRELHPALDAHLIAFVERTQGHAGWPLNVFLTPEGYPLVGLTYAPKEDFAALLQRVANKWRGDADNLRELARRGLLQLQAEPPPKPSRRLDPPALRDALIEQGLAAADELEGGFGRQNRFPMAPQLLALLEAAEGNVKSGQLRRFLALTLDQVANEGLRDQLAGGFFRYTVDPGWQVPHFEKMLYTQALLALVYLRAAEILDRPDYRTVAFDTLDFTLRTFRGEQGGYIASLSAIDTTGTEGGSYLWNMAELAKQLGSEEFRLASAHWRLSGPAVHELGQLPRRGLSAAELAQQEKTDPTDMAKRLETIRNQLLELRQDRLPPRDTKELAAWNGLLLSALSTAAALDDKYREPARGLRNFLMHALGDGETLSRARHLGRPVGQAGLADYAFVAQGLSRWADLAKDRSASERARRLIELAWQRFHRDGLWHQDDSTLLPGVAGEALLAEGPLPSAAAVLIDLSLNSADEDLNRRAVEAIRHAQGKTQASPFWHPTQTLLSIKGFSD